MPALQFAAVQNDLRTGDVLLFRGTGLLSWIVKMRTKSVYTHAGFVYRMKCNGSERVCVVEALEPGGVRLYPLDVRLAQGAVVDWYALDQAVNGEHAAAFALKQWGKPYAWRQLFWAFSRMASLVRHLFKMSLTNVQTRAYFCSELVATALADAGWRTDEPIDPDATSPGDVSRFSCLHRRGSLQL